MLVVRKNNITLKGFLVKPLFGRKAHDSYTECFTSDSIFSPNSKTIIAAIKSVFISNTITICFF